MDERYLRELELDGVARLFSGLHASSQAARDMPAHVPGPAAPTEISTAIRTVIADPLRGGASPWMVAGLDVMLEGEAGRLLDAMLAAVGLRRRGDDAPDGAAPAVLLRLGDCTHEAGIPSVSVADPRQLLRQPAAKAAAWEALVRARRLANG